MKFKTSILLICFIFMNVFAPFSYAKANNDSTVAILKEVHGDVTIMKNGGKREIRAVNQMPIHEGDAIRTGDKSSVTINFGDESESTLGEYGLITISELSDNDSTSDDMYTIYSAFKRKNVGVKQRSGSLWSKVKNAAGSGKRHKVETATAIMGVRGTLFLTYIDPNTGEENVSVFDGAVDHEKITMQNLQGVLVTPGYGLTFGNNQSPANTEVVNYRSLINRIDATVAGEMNIDTVAVAEQRLEEAKQALEQLTVNKTKDGAKLALELAKKSEQISLIAAGVIKGSLDSNKRQAIDSRLSNKKASLQYLNEMANYLRYESTNISEQVTEIAKEVGLNDQEINAIVNDFAFDREQFAKVNPVSDVTPVTQKPSQPSSSSGGGSGGGGSTPTDEKPQNNEEEEYKYRIGSYLSSWSNESTSPDSIYIKYSLTAYYDKKYTNNGSINEEQEDEDLYLYSSVYNIDVKYFHLYFNKPVNESLVIQKIENDNGDSIDLPQTSYSIYEYDQREVTLFLNSEQINQLINYGHGVYTFHVILDGQEYQIENYINIYKYVNELDIKQEGKNITITVPLGENFDIYGSVSYYLYNNKQYYGNRVYVSYGSPQCGNETCKIVLNDIKYGTEYYLSFRVGDGKYEINYQDSFITKIPDDINFINDPLKEIYESNLLERQKANIDYKSVLVEKKPMEELGNISINDVYGFPLDPKQFNVEITEKAAWLHYAQFIVDYMNAIDTLKNDYKDIELFQVSYDENDENQVVIDGGVVTSPLTLTKEQFSNATIELDINVYLEGLNNNFISFVKEFDADQLQQMLK